MKKYTRCVLIIWNGNLLHNLKTIHPRVKSQVRGPNDKSSAWKWETIPLYTLNTFKDATKYMKMIENYKKSEKL